MWKSKPRENPSDSVHNICIYLFCEQPRNGITAVFSIESFEQLFDGRRRVFRRGRRYEWRIGWEQIGFAATFEHFAVYDLSPISRRIGFNGFIRTIVTDSGRARARKLDGKCWRIEPIDCSPSKCTQFTRFGKSILYGGGSQERDQCIKFKYTNAYKWIRHMLFCVV